jgi:hypothetical protein
LAAGAVRLPGIQSVGCVPANGFAGATAIGMGGGLSYFQPVIPGLNMFGVNVF